jgi:uncharacterized protein with HEPN domain
MSNEREVIDYLEDVLMAMEKAEAFTHQMSYSDFVNDDKTVFAVIRAIEIIGEAVKHLPEDFRIKFPGIPWRDIAGMRDVLVHEYFGVDLETVWKTVTEDIYIMKPQLADIFGKVRQEVKRPT